MLTELRYKGFTPETQIKTEAEEVLDHVQKCVPTGTAVIAMLEFEDGLYTCSVDAYLKRGSFYAQATDKDPMEALHHAEETILKKVLKTKETRFYTRADSLTDETPGSSEYVN
jgi:ribosome-associated translation inhibitor RaiA